MNLYVEPSKQSLLICPQDKMALPTKGISYYPGECRTIGSIRDWPRTIQIELGPKGEIAMSKYRIGLQQKRA